MANILLIGGHGKVALLAEPKLVAAGHQVYAVIRKESQAAAISERGAQPIILDIEQATTSDIEELIRQTKADVLVWSAGAGGGDSSRTYAIDQDAAICSMEAARQAGLKRYIMVSYLGSGRGHTVDEDHGFYAYERAKAVADAYLRDSNLDFTILGPGRLSEEPATGIDLGSQPAGEFTSRELVAELIVASIADDSTIGKTIAFTDGKDDPVQALATAPAKRDLS